MSDTGDTGLGALYPDILAADGLAQALASALAPLGHGVEIRGVWASEEWEGRSAAAAVELRRGTAVVYLGAGVRKFSVGFNAGHAKLAEGSTDNFELVVDAISAWISGADSSQLVSRFEFLHVGPLAAAVESGDLAQEQWRRVLQSNELSTNLAMLRGVHLDPFLATLFPVMSHGRLVLQTDPTAETTSSLFLVPMEANTYKVYALSDAGNASIALSLDEAISQLKMLAEREI